MHPIPIYPYADVDIPIKAIRINQGMVEFRFDGYQPAYRSLTDLNTWLHSEGHHTYKSTEIITREHPYYEKGDIITCVTQDKQRKRYSCIKKGRNKERGRMFLGRMLEITNDDVELTAWVHEDSIFSVINPEPKHSMQRYYPIKKILDGIVISGKTNHLSIVIEAPFDAPNFDQKHIEHVYSDLNKHQAILLRDRLCAMGIATQRIWTVRTTKPQASLLNRDLDKGWGTLLLWLMRAFHPATRRRRCYNSSGNPKRIFSTKEEALSLISIERDYNDQQEKHLQAYRCHRHDGWHIGNRR